MWHAAGGESQKEDSSVGKTKTPPVVLLWPPSTRLVVSRCCDSYRCVSTLAVVAAQFGGQAYWSISVLRDMFQVHVQSRLTSCASAVAVAITAFASAGRGFDGSSFGHRRGRRCLGFGGSSLTSRAIAGLLWAIALPDPSAVIAQLGALVWGFAFVVVAFAVGHLELGECPAVQCPMDRFAGPVPYDGPVSYVRPLPCAGPVPYEMFCCELSGSGRSQRTRWSSPEIRVAPA